MSSDSSALPQFYTNLVSDMQVRAYQMIGQQIDDLFTVKYKNNNKFIQFIYYGYTEQFDQQLHSEDSHFVLIDCNVQSWKLCKSLDDAIEFLELTIEQKLLLEYDIRSLVTLENMLSTSLTAHNMLPNVNYFRKLNILQYMVDAMKSEN